MDQSAKALQALELFVGSWETKGIMQAIATDEQVSFTAAESYNWEAGGQILLHRFNADMPYGKVQGLEIIGYDVSNLCYFIRSYDNSGVEILMGALNDGSTWYFKGDNLRFKGTFSDDAKIFQGEWDVIDLENGEWRQLMIVELCKHHK